MLKTAEAEKLEWNGTPLERVENGFFGRGERHTVEIKGANGVISVVERFDVIKKVGDVESRMGILTKTMQMDTNGRLTSAEIGFSRGENDKFPVKATVDREDEKKWASILLDMVKHVGGRYDVDPAKLFSDLKFAPLKRSIDGLPAHGELTMRFSGNKVSTTEEITRDAPPVHPPDYIGAVTITKNYSLITGLEEFNDLIKRPVEMGIIELRLNVGVSSQAYLWEDRGGRITLDTNEIWVNNVEEQMGLLFASRQGAEFKEIVTPH